MPKNIEFNCASHQLTIKLPQQAYPSLLRLGVMAAFTSYEHLNDNFDALMQRYAEYTGQQQQTNTNSSSNGELNTIREEKPTEPIHIVNIVIQHHPNYELDQDADNKLCAAFIKSKEVS